ncbi:hypothetical protein GYMLUDRAFT_38748 [Collybiopsis luxurians FD-317 M1]|nr:hypothetical protein GYMLUDRAFT_38748 [Collybiopsis luxurians FD-317 M1]
MTSLPNFPTFPDLRTALDADEVREMVLEFLTSSQAVGGLSQQDMDKVISKLPRLTEKQVIESGHEESVCPICFVPLLALLAEEETASAMDSPAHPIESLGVTRLAESFQCNHIFCRRDITHWVRDGHDSCPTCRRPLLERSEDTSTTSSPAEDAYGPAQLQNLLQHLSMEGLLGGQQDPTHSSFSGFFFGPDLNRSGTSTDDNDERNEYNAMYS